ncbi:MAG: homoserine O-acetyltransferase [Bacteroidales bacterium]
MRRGKLFWDKPFPLEREGLLPYLTITYHTSGKLNKSKDNVIWICHAFSAGSDVSEWWPDMIGKGKCFDPSKYFVVCANILGSCYGTTGPLSVNPETNRPYYSSFPFVTIRDMAAAHEILREYLGIKRIKLLIGSSIGAFQGLEWNIMKPQLFEHFAFISGSAKTSPWAVAFSEAQRMALLSDPTFHEASEHAGSEGMKAARSVALLSYRNYQIYGESQAEKEIDRVNNFRVSSYQRYQGEKLAKRFNAFSYYVLLNALDSHNVGRGRNSIIKALSKVEAKTLVVGITTDLLFPVSEQKFVASYIKNSDYVEIDSIYGHDAFLIETGILSRLIIDKCKIK